MVAFSHIKGASFLVVVFSSGELHANINNTKSINDVVFMIVSDLKNERLKLLIKIDFGNF